MSAPISVQIRSQVAETVKTNLDKALKLARTIPDGWYRCQSLAEVAFYTASKSNFRELVREALQAAEETRQPNRIVSVSAWIIWVMAKRKDVRDEEILPIVEKMLEIMRIEAHPVKRSDALFVLFEAIYSRRNLREMVLNPLLSACREMNSWKKSRTLGDIALVLAVDDLKRAETVLEMIEKESKKKSLRREIEENKWLGAHDFLPFYAKGNSKTEN
jgi:hypothetical protein